MYYNVKYPDNTVGGICLEKTQWDITQMMLRMKKIMEQTKMREERKSKMKKQMINNKNRKMSRQLQNLKMNKYW